MVTCINIMQAWINKLYKVRRGVEDLFPTPISEFCYKREFEWNKLADKMFEFINIHECIICNQ